MKIGKERTGVSARGLIVASVLSTLATMAGPLRAAPIITPGLVFQSETFTIGGLPGQALLGFQPFQPSLGTLDRVNVRIDGVFGVNILVLAGQTILPIVEMRADGLGLGFSFSDSPPARFIFPPVSNPILDPEDPPPPLDHALFSTFNLTFSFTEVTDLTGLVVPSTSAIGATLAPPLVLGRRADFVERFPGDFILEQFLFFPPSGAIPGGPFEGGGVVLLEYEFTPHVAAVPEPALAGLLIAGLAALSARRRPSSARPVAASAGGPWPLRPHAASRARPRRARRRGCA